MDIIINIDKPEDISSHQAVIKVKRLFAAKKAGHAGTLDPIATGVLIVCLNEATKITRFLSDLNKEYIVRLKLGERTDTYDSTGRLIEKRDCGAVKESDLQEILKNFTGRIKQTPPMYSAVKIDGRPLYKLARKGIEIERPERDIHIYKIDPLSFQQPYLDLRVNCSKGTYIRTLCDDIGNALGSGAHMTSLKRTRVGDFRIEDSVSMDEFRQINFACCSIDSALSHLDEIILDEASYRRARNGMPIPLLMNNSDSIFAKENRGMPNNLYIDQYVRLKTPANILFGIGRKEGHNIKIERLLGISSEN